MIRGLALLLVFQCLGEAAAHLTHSPVPGPVIGMVLLLAMLVWRRATPASLDDAASGLLAHLSIFFIPAAVGVMLYASDLARNSLSWIAAIAVSTAAAIVVSALILKRFLKPAEGE
jgi:holin-like protein